VAIANQGVILNQCGHRLGRLISMRPQFRRRVVVGARLFHSFESSIMKRIRDSRLHDCPDPKLRP
jgi:hypothetical protein